MSIQQDGFLLFGPGIFFNTGIEMIVPAFTTLFPDSTGEMTSDGSPIFRTKLGNELDDDFIFLLGPGPFDELWIEYFLPSVKTLDTSSSGQVSCDFLPIFSAVQFHSLSQLFILIRSPTTTFGASNRTFLTGAFHFLEILNLE